MDADGEHDGFLHPQKIVSLCRIRHEPVIMISMGRNSILLKQLRQSPYPSTTPSAVAIRIVFGILSFHRNRQIPENTEMATRFH